MSNESQNGGSPDRMRTIVADDDPLVRGLIKEVLQRAGIIVIAEASDGREAVELGLHYRPDVILMDVVMPGKDGIWATGELHRRAPEVRVLLLTIASDTELGVLGLRAGASGYLGKDVDLNQLPSVLHQLIDGQPALSARLATALIERVRAQPEGGLGVRPVSSALTTREWEVLDRLCAGLTTDEIADQFVLSPETVRSHIKKVLRKLGVHSQAEAIEAASGLRTASPTPFSP
jgi:two-component system, NarL family, response regulator LiaR